MEKPNIVSISEGGIFIKEMRIKHSDIEKAVDLLENMGNNMVYIHIFETMKIDCNDFYMKCKNCGEEKLVYSVLTSESARVIHLCEDCSEHIYQYISSLANRRLDYVMPYVI